MAVLALTAMPSPRCGSSTPNSGATTRREHRHRHGARQSHHRGGQRDRHGEVHRAANKGTILENSSGMPLYTFGGNNGGSTNM